MIELAEHVREIVVLWARAGCRPHFRNSTVAAGVVGAIMPASQPIRLQVGDEAPTSSVPYPKLLFLNPNLTTETERLTVIWGAKEAVFKVVNREGISFKNHIFVAPFDLNTLETTATLALDSKPRQFAVQYQLLADYALVYTFETT